MAQSSRDAENELHKVKWGYRYIQHDSYYITLHHTWQAFYCTAAALEHIS